MIDPLKLALADRLAPLEIKARAAGFTCVICGAEQEPHAWRVNLPGRLGTACPGCAGDHGWVTE